MPDVVKEFARKSGRGSRAVTPPEWFDGKIRRFVSGKDFTCTTESFRYRMQMHAWRRGLRTHSQLAGKDLLFQAVPTNGST